MKFSYSLIKQFVPKLQSVDQLVDALTLHAFEVDAVEGDMIDIKILPNRYSDAASHWGIAREVAAILGVPVKIPKVKVSKPKTFGEMSVTIEAPKGLCSRIAVRYMDGIQIKPSPEWMQRILVSCGMRPINNLVDITNYVTLETGQPIHALDFKKMEEGKLVVRFARANEPVELLDGSRFNLDTQTLVLADAKDPLDIAGIKGGRKAEITEKTTAILLTVANFDGVSVYKASKKYGVSTDASVRFAHHLSPFLVEDAVLRATELIAELCEANVGELIDAHGTKARPVILKFDHTQFKKLTGLKISKTKALGYLKALGFVVKGDLVMAPKARTDIERLEDLADEIVRLYGYDKLPATPPVVAIRPTVQSGIVTLKGLLRTVLTRMPFIEVYNLSFISGKDAAAEEIKDVIPVPVQNPISIDFAYLRTNLETHLLHNIADNFRYVDDVRIFEIGRVFQYEKERVHEQVTLGIAIGTKHGMPLTECKGAIDAMLRKLGVMDASYVPMGGDVIRVESDHHVLGNIHIIAPRVLRNVVVAEFNLDELLSVIDSEREYEPLVKYPAITRDISMAVPAHTLVGNILEHIQSVAPTLIYDVDLVDYFEDEKKIGADQKSLTFRIVFQSKERTLTDEEVNKTVENIVSILQERVGAVMR